MYGKGKPEKRLLKNDIKSEKMGYCSKNELTERKRIEKAMSGGGKRTTSVKGRLKGAKQSQKRKTGRASFVKQGTALPQPVSGRRNKDNGGVEGAGFYAKPVRGGQGWGKWKNATAGRGTHCGENREGETGEVWLCGNSGSQHRANGGV